MKLRKAALVLLMLCLIVPAYAQKKGYNDIFVFGDSLSDNGNAAPLWNGVMQPEMQAFGGDCYHYWNGRFSNGPVWVEYLAANMHARLHDYAYGSAKTDMFSVWGDPFDVPGVQAQVDLFLDEYEHDSIPPHSLFVILAGANDLFAGTGNPAGPAFNVLTAVRTLVDAGATEVLVVNLPDIGRTYYAEWVEQQGIPNYVKNMTMSSIVFNACLQDYLAAYAPENARIIAGDLYGIVNDIALDPAAYGLSVTAERFTDPSPNSAIANRGNYDGLGYFFWDYLHPSTQVHAILAGRLGEQLESLLRVNQQNHKK